MLRAVVLCRVDRCLGSYVVLGLFCRLHVTHTIQPEIPLQIRHYFHTPLSRAWVVSSRSFMPQNRLPPGKGEWTTCHAQCGRKYTPLRNALNKEAKCTTGLVRVGKRKGANESEHAVRALCTCQPRAQITVACMGLQLSRLIKPLIADATSGLGTGQRQMATVIANLRRDGSAWLSSYRLQTWTLIRTSTGSRIIGTAHVHNLYQVL